MNTVKFIIGLIYVIAVIGFMVLAIISQVHGETLTTICYLLWILVLFTFMKN